MAGIERGRGALRLRSPCSAQRFEVSRIEMRLVADHDQRTDARIGERGDAPAQRGTHAFPPVGTIDAAQRQIVHLGKNGIRVRAEHDHRLARSGGQGRACRSAYEGFATLDQQLLGLPQARRTAGGKQHDTVCGASAYRCGGHGVKRPLPACAQ